MDTLTLSDSIQSKILVIRGQRVILDADLAALYGVTTRRLKEQVRRNSAKFPESFCFKLEHAEAVTLSTLRSQNATLKQGEHFKFLPLAFTEYGALQAANVLSSARATLMSIAVIESFVRLRQMLATHKALSAKIDELDSRVGRHDKELAEIVAAIRLLMEPPAPKRTRKIGFHRGNR